MSGEFIGVATGAVYGRLVAEMVKGCLRALAELRRRLAAQPQAAPGRASDLGTSHGTVKVTALRQALRKGVCFLLCASKCAPSTVDKYGRCITRFLDHLETTRTGQVDRAVISAYLDKLAEDGLGNAGIRLQLCALRKVFDRVLKLDLTEGIDHAPRPPQVAPATPEQLQLLWESCVSSKERFIVGTLMLNGERLRASELALLAVPTHAVFPGRVTPVGEERESEPSGGDISGDRPVLLLRKAREGYQWILKSGRPGRPMSDRGVRWILEQTATRCGRRLCSTAIRKAGPLLRLPVPGAV